MPKQKVYEYVVTGRGAFPIDMLRYDCAWPKTERDSTKIAPAFNHEREITLFSLVRGPTVARWQSFGWRIEMVQEHKIERG